MPVVGVEYIDEPAVIRRNDVSLEKIECGIRTITQSPIRLIDPPLPHQGFCGFRYFDLDAYEGKLHRPGRMAIGTQNREAYDGESHGRIEDPRRRGSHERTVGRSGSDEA